MSLPPATVRVKVRKLNIATKSEETVEEDVAVESPIEIVLNGTSIATLLATPDQIEELSMGFLLDEGIVESKDQFVSMRHSGMTVDVNARVAGTHLEASRDFGLILTSCISSRHSGPHERPDWPNVRSNYRVRAEDILEMIRELTRSSVQFARTGAMHSAAIFLGNVMRAFAEDVGRHNAIDKVIGSSAKQGIDLAEAVLATTGRQPADLVLKTARVGIPISVSMRGPIHSGIVAAERTGLTLVCFARGRNMNVYTSHERVIL